MPESAEDDLNNRCDRCRGTEDVRRFTVETEVESWDVRLCVKHWPEQSD